MAGDIDFAELYRIAFGPPSAGTGEPARSKAGREKCTATSKQTGRRCGRWPVPGATVCKSHGGAAPQVRDAAARRVQEQQAMALARQTAGDIDVRAYGDPFSALEFALAYSRTLAERLARLVEGIPDGELRYRGKVGEQLRGEVTACQRALADLRTAATESAKLGLAERRAKISQARLAHEERAFLAALQVANIPVERQEQARAVLARELLRGVVIEGEVSG